MDATAVVSLAISVASACVAAGSYREARRSAAAAERSQRGAVAPNLTVTTFRVLPAKDGYGLLKADGIRCLGPGPAVCVTATVFHEATDDRFPMEPLGGNPVVSLAPMETAPDAFQAPFPWTEAPFPEGVSSAGLLVLLEGRGADGSRCRNVLRVCARQQGGNAWIDDVLPVPWDEFCALLRESRARTRDGSSEESTNATSHP